MHTAAALPCRAGIRGRMWKERLAHSRRHPTRNRPATVRRSSASSSVSSSFSSPKRLLDRLALPGEEYRALLGDVKTILEADPELAVDRDRRLVAETHPGLERCGVALHE